MEEITKHMEESWEREGDNVKLIGSECKNCESAFFPARIRCTECYDYNNMEKLVIDSKGQLYTYTIVHAAPSQFNPPYIVGYVDFPEKVRVFGQLDMPEDSFDQLKMGMDVSITSGIIREQANDDGDIEIISYKFKPDNL